MSVEAADEPTRHVKRREVAGSALSQLGSPVAMLDSLLSCMIHVLSNGLEIPVLARHFLIPSAFVASLIWISPPAAASDCWTAEYETRFSDPGGPTFYWRRNKLASAALNPYHYLVDECVAPGDDQRFFVHGLYGRGAPTYELYKEQSQLHVATGDSTWKELGISRTTKGGAASFYLTGEEILGPGAHHLKAFIPGDNTDANGFLWSWNPGMKAIVTDIDGTLTKDDLQQYLDIIYDIGPLDYVPEPKPGAVELMQFWGSRNFAVVYITARPSYLKDVTIQWLHDLGFPLGPVICYGASGGVLPPIGSNETIRYKSKRIDDFEERLGTRFVVAYGNSDTDRDAFCQAAEVEPERIFMIDCATCAPPADCPHKLVEDNWHGHLADLEGYGIPVISQPCD